MLKISKHLPIKLNLTSQLNYLFLYFFLLENKTKIVYTVRFFVALLLLPIIWLDAADTGDAITSFLK